MLISTVIDGKCAHGTSEESDSSDSEIYLGVRLFVCQYTQTNVVEHRVNFEVEKWTSLQQK